MQSEVTPLIGSCSSEAPHAEESLTEPQWLVAGRGTQTYKPPSLPSVRGTVSGYTISSPLFPSLPPVKTNKLTGLPKNQTAMACGRASSSTIPLSSQRPLLLLLM